MRLRRRNELSLTDPLTGLLGRAALIDRAQHALDRRVRYGGTVAVIFLDIDDFRAINSSLGYRSGDRLLAAVAERLLATLRTADTLGRTGGDDFAVVLEDLVDASAAYDVGTRLLEAMIEPFDLGGEPVSVTASIGITVSTGAETAEELLGQAGTALDRARDSGDGRYAVFETGMLSAARSRVALKADLRTAIAERQVTAWYQPIVALADRTTVGVEALARWEHPTRGLVMPDEFIPVAERTDLILALDTEILRRAAHDGARWNGPGRIGPLGISVNMSARTLEEPGLADTVLTAIDVAGLSPRRLTVEITEHTLIVDSTVARASLARLRQAGVAVALDDFGVGHSSLSYLERFPVDKLKIDRSFVSRVTDAEGRRLTGAIVAMAGTLGLDVVVEGIETRAQLEALLDLGCTTGQGFFLGRPAPASDVSARRAAGVVRR
jgi:diguanylate cyclase (GGDEF)-like protein